MVSKLAFRNAMEAIHHLLDPAPPWHDILTTARELVGADSGSFIMFGKGQDLLMLEQTGLDETAEREYREHFYAEDTVAKVALAASAGTWWDSTQILPASVMEKNAFHADFLRKHRIGQILAFIAQDDEFEQAALSFQRVTPQTAALSALTNGAVADYTQAFTKALAQRRQASFVQLEAIETIFASFGEATFLATRMGVIWRLSPLAEELLRRANMISTRDGSITHSDKKIAQRLQTTLSRVATTSASVVLTVPTTWGEAYRFDISPAHPSIKLGTESILFVRIRKSSAFSQPDVGELRATFGITSAEARVLAALVTGHAPNDYASASGLADRTVRNQIAALMRKMGCNRQSELVRLGSLLL
ncbi:LuxR family transcriptional regulator [Polaromonas sp. P1(28)-13]|nr:LuxR family transcriptional regulator [Polaromonas sp. P1(28)-13]